MIKEGIPPQLPPAGYGLGELEVIMGWPKRTAYHRMYDGKLEVFKDSVGNLRVHPYVVMRLLDEQAEKNKTKDNTVSVR